MQYAEENSMKVLNFSKSLIIFSLVLAAPLLWAAHAHAYAANQEAQWDADLVEAKARAKDFKKHKERDVEASREREKDAHAEDALLKKQAEEYERDRAAYARHQKTLPTQEQLDDVMNAAEAKEQAADAKKQEAIREDYVKGRNHYEAALEKDAFISEAQEYNVHSAPSVEWQNAHKPPDLLKFKVEESKNK